MARPVILSNGRLHVGLNLYGEVHDFYYPYVGLENHAAAKSLRHRVGVWVDGQMSWLDDGNWQYVYKYHAHTLIGYIRAHNPALGIILEFDDAVDSSEDVFMRNIHVINEFGHSREARLFLHQVFDISDGAGNGDTVQYLPDSDVILHYRGRRFFAVGGQHVASKKEFDQYSVGLFGIENHMGTYVDAEDGQLSGNTVEHGRVDSVVGFNLTLDAHCSARVNYWIAAGLTDRQAVDRDKLMRRDGVLHRLLLTSGWWRQWIQPALTQAKALEPAWQESFLNSVLLIKAHIDSHGAILASTDTTMLKYSRDAYGYCWTRDGAYAVWPLIRLGYTKEPLAFFNFCRQVMHTHGYLMHKYQPDGALGSSWHPYLHEDGTVAPPIQEDETAIVLYIFTEYFQMHQDMELLSEYYPIFVKPMAEFLSSYIDETTGLPRASYDIWEERFLTTTYTTALICRALISASELAEKMSDPKHAVRWSTVAEDIKTKAHELLYNTEEKVLYKGLRTINKEVVYDQTVDASAVFGSCLYGLFLPGSDEMVASVNTLKARLAMPQADVLGIARYENDYYNRVSQETPGNPWFITTLWLAQYYLETNQAEAATTLIEWCRSYMMQTGVLPEQINPYTKQYVSVAPLCWSQAEYVSTLLDYIGSAKTPSH